MTTEGAHEFDVVVVGFGIAGLAAATSALEEGARVAVLERAIREERGGNTRYTEAYLRMKSEDEVSEDFVARLAANAGHHLDPSLVNVTSEPYEAWPALVKALGFTDPELISTFAENASPTIKWLKSHGVKFDFLPTYFITLTVPRMMPVGGGQALVEALGEHVERIGASVYYETTARRLVQDESGAVVGLEAVGRDNRPIIFEAPAVVLACGGFEGNPEMQTRYLGPQARYLRPIARGGYYNKGEGIQMALDLGAAPCGDFGNYHAEPVDPRSGQAEPAVMIFSYGILVNREARRFCDEGVATVDLNYEPIARRVMHEPDGIAYVILDGKIDDVPNWRKAVRSDQAAIEAPTLGELAAQLELDAEALEATVTAFNGACPAGTFKPLELDGLRTSGLDPAKSNWARPLDTAPFRAYPMISANVFTFGGLKVNTKAQVLNRDGEGIPGLYAAGEVIGMYYGAYTGSTSVLRGAVFGRIAGLDAAARASRATSARRRGKSSERPRA